MQASKCWKWSWWKQIRFQDKIRHSLKLIFVKIVYFIEYNAHTSIVRTWISQWILAKKLILFFKNNFTRINHCKFIHHRSHLKPLLSYLPCIVCKEYFSIIFYVKKWALYSIKYGISNGTAYWLRTRYKMSSLYWLKYSLGLVVVNSLYFR
jgi:hypothetical protein